METKNEIIQKVTTNQLVTSHGLAQRTNSHTLSFSLSTLIFFSQLFNKIKNLHKKHSMRCEKETFGSPTNTLDLYKIIYMRQ